LIDTYDVKQGLKNAIIVAKELKTKGKNFQGETQAGGQKGRVRGNSATPEESRIVYHCT